MSVYKRVIVFLLVAGVFCTADAQQHFPQSLKTPILEALSQFPELEKVSIDFLFKDKIKNAKMQAQPKMSFIFKNRKKRDYKIKISRMVQVGDQLQPIETLPQEILVGWFAHELGHIVDYTKRSAMNMTGFGLRYVTSRRFLKKAERRADVFAVKHGFADHIIKTKEYILEDSDFSNDYKSRIDDLYLSPKEIRALKAEFE